jgi:cobalt-zinc-cadmium efflux system membrane fusion protein
MTIAMSDRSRASVRSALPWLPWAALGLSLLLLAASVLLHDALFHRGTTAAAPGDKTPGAGGPPAAPTTVSLPEPKFKSAGIATQKAELVSLPAELGVPGRIEANLNREVQITPRAPGIIREVKVELGQTVKKGDVLAVLDSADIGTARLDLRARQYELSTARIEANWKKLVAQNVAALIPELRKRTESDVIEKAYADRPLGTFRATLLQAYAEFDITSHEEEKTGGLFKKGILGEHPAFLAKHTREGAQAKFESVLEQARFDANLQTITAEQNVKKAEYAVIDAAQRLRILGVPEDVKALIDHAGDVAKSGQPVGDEVTAYPILAPFDATVITKTPMAVASQKADIHDVLFALADLSTVWVQANIPESDFALLPALKQGTIRLGATAYPGKSFVARLLSIGATVDPTTRTVPMLATTANTDDLLKLGMFVRITLDTAVDVKALTVPSSAVVEIEGQKGVFVPGGTDGRTFKFKPVKIGRESGDRLVVSSGLDVGDPVVSKGAFLLKSELVLQSQTGED